MKYVRWVALLAVPLLGCAAPSSGRTAEPWADRKPAAESRADRAPGSHKWSSSARPAGPGVANLALGSHPVHVQLGEELTYRSDWPAFRNGYVIEDVASFFSYSYDDQSFYDRFGGGYFGLFEATRQGIIAR